jgi:phage/plasmid-associated DNA primase
LNENGEDIELTIKLIMSANNIPNITEPDEAIKNRVKIIPFGSVWCANAPISEEEQMATRTFKMDPDFEKRIPILASAFLWILVQYFPKYCAEGLKDPQSVIDYTREYWNNNDIIGKFVSDNVKEAYVSEGVRDMNSKVTMNELYTEFKTWFRSSYPQDRLPNRDVVRADFIKRWGRSGSDGWIGLFLPKTTYDILPINPTF